MRRLWAVGTAAAIVTGAAVPAFGAGKSTVPVGSMPKGDAVLIAGARRYELQVATTPAQQRLGLGDRLRVPASSGMLFVFRSSGPRCLWMKGMRFALDMIWLSPADKVISLQEDVPVKAPVYCAVAEDLVELDAGQAQVAGIRVGRLLKLEMPAV
jgi:uncharacterized membrane protein (UPF0127 family)